MKEAGIDPAPERASSQHTGAIVGRLQLAGGGAGSGGGCALAAVLSLESTVRMGQNLTEHI